MKVSEVRDFKPKNEVVQDYKPNMGEVNENSVNRTYEMTIAANQYFGFSALTYPSAIDVISPKSP